LMRITLDKHQRRVFVNAEMKIREISWLYEQNLASQVRGSALKSYSVRTGSVLAFWRNFICVIEGFSAYRAVNNIQPGYKIQSVNYA
jgi:hypothetical protein